MSDFPWAFSCLISPCLEREEYGHTPTLFNDDLCAAPAQPSKRSEGMDKKWLHKVIERQRRSDMKSRYSQLTSLIPAKNKTGHTPIADRLSEATDYISHLKEKVNELAKKRDEMKVMATMNKVNDYCYKKEEKVVSLSQCEESPIVNVNHVGSQVEVITNTLKEQMKLSELLFAVEEQGLQIVSASSLDSNGKVFHTVHCKVLETQNFKSNFKLKQTLWQLIERNRNPDVSPIDL